MGKQKDYINLTGHRLAAVNSRRHFEMAFSTSSCRNGFLTRARRNNNHMTCSALDQQSTRANVYRYVLYAHSDGHRISIIYPAVDRVSNELSARRMCNLEVYNIYLLTIVRSYSYLRCIQFFRSINLFLYARDADLSVMSNFRKYIIMKSVRNVLTVYCLLVSSLVPILKLQSKLILFKFNSYLIFL